MEDDKTFYTFRGYSLRSRDKDLLSPSMEDYVEMIYRLAAPHSYTRVAELAGALNVQPPSASRMLQRLSQEGLVAYEKYGIIRLTHLGQRVGQHLIERHNTLEEFLTLLGVVEPLEDVERIEHNISDSAMEKIALMVDFLKRNPSFLTAWREHSLATG